MTEEDDLRFLENRLTGLRLPLQFGDMHRTALYLNLIDDEDWREMNDSTFGEKVWELIRDYYDSKEN